MDGEKSEAHIQQQLQWKAADPQRRVHSNTNRTAPAGHVSRTPSGGPANTPGAAASRGSSGGGAVAVTDTTATYSDLAEIRAVAAI